jgi:hypothetical protein
MRHSVDEPGNEHAVRETPSQVPAQAPPPAQPVRVPRGAPLTGEQVPADPATSHASH